VVADHAWAGWIKEGEASKLASEASVAGSIADVAVPSEITSEHATRQFIARSVADTADAPGFLGVVEAGTKSIARVVADHGDTTVLSHKGTGALGAARIVADGSAAQWTAGGEQAGARPIVAGTAADACAATNSSHALADSFRAERTGEIDWSRAGVVADLTIALVPSGPAGKVLVARVVADDSATPEISALGACRVAVT